MKYSFTFFPRAAIPFKSIFWGANESASHKLLGITNARLFTAGTGREAARAAAAAGWGLLRNAFQEFAGPKFRGDDVDAASNLDRQSQNSVPEAADAFGTAMSGSTWYSPRVLPAASSEGVSMAAKPLSGQHWVITGALDPAELTFTRGKSCEQIKEYGCVSDKLTMQYSAL